MNNALLNGEFQEILSEVEHILHKYSEARLAHYQLKEQQLKLKKTIDALNESVKWAVSEYGEHSFHDFFGNLLAVLADSDEVTP